MTHNIKVEHNKSGVVDIIFQRPQVHNALNAEMIAEVTAVLQELAEEEQVRLLCLQGAGNSFCAGADLTWMQHTVDYDAKENFNDAMKLSQMLHALYHFPKPTLAIAHGSVYGGGVGLLACCDIVIAQVDAKFCLAETKLGLVPATIAPYLAEAIGVRALRYLTLTGVVISATYLQELGLVHEVLDDMDSLMAHKKQLVEHILGNAPQALIVAKQMIASLRGRNMDTELEMELAELIASLRVGQEAQDRMLKFLKR